MLNSTARIKYFIRGLGMGILFTAFCFILIKGGKGNSLQITDAEIVKRAKELGMVEKLDDTLNRLEGNTKAPENTIEPEETTKPEETIKPEESKAPVKTTKPNGQSSDTTVDFIIVKIADGDTSEAVSRKLEGAGLIDDYRNFNEYLKERNMQSKMQVGTHQIKVGASFKQIAEQISRYPKRYE